MRLTLRNLLAYMDDLLDPESARVIGQKIEESEFASGLLHRIRDVTRRTKIGAPEVIDRKAALDPNTVAEYLDNILPTDRVTDFEKACLDSDVELSEVAACHQILTLVLGEPAEVRPESRVRMYHLPETAASHTYIEHDEGETETERQQHRIDSPKPSPHRRRQAEIPEYLLAARRRRRQLYGFAVVAAVLCVAVYLGATGSLNGLLGLEEPAAPSDDQLAFDMPDRPPLPEPAEPIPEMPAPQPVVTTDSAPVQESPAQSPESVVPVPVTPPSTDVVSAPVEPATAFPETDAEPLPMPDSVVPVVPTPSPTENATTEIPVPVTPLEAPVSPPNPTPDPGQMASVIPAPALDEQEPMIAEPEVPEIVQGREIGRLINAEELVLVTVGEGEPFARIAKTEPIRIGHRVVSLPTSRPMLLLDGKLIVEMAGGAELNLLSSDENEPLHIELASGQMLLAPSEEAGNLQVSVTAGNVTGILSLADATTMAALEVGRASGPIPDPLAQPVPATVRLWGVSGSLSWQETGATDVALEKHMVLNLAAGAGSAPVPSEPPLWVDPDLLDTPDQRLSARANGLLKKAFDSEKPADLILRENVSHRLREVRRLARESLSWIEDFDDVVEVINHPEPYVEWPEVIDLLRESIRRGPRTAEAVRSSMEAKYGVRGNELFELLWKYDTPQLSRQAAQQLVEYLSDGTLAFRVLSFNNLNRITGKGFYYRAEEPEGKREQPLQRWIRWANEVPEVPAPAQVRPPAK